MKRLLFVIAAVCFLMCKQALSQTNFPKLLSKKVKLDSLNSKNQNSLRENPLAGFYNNMPIMNPDTSYKFNMPNCLTHSSVNYNMPVVPFVFENEKQDFAVNKFLGKKP